MAGLAEGAWRTAKEFQAWLERTHRIELGLKGCYYWLGKSRGRLKAPRPVYAKQAAGAVIDFKPKKENGRADSASFGLDDGMRGGLGDRAGIFIR